MNSYVNMGMGALLGTVFVLMSVSIASEGIFHSGAPEQEGFAIVAEETGSDAGGAAEVAAVPIATLMANADAARGETAFRKCVSCHTPEKGGANKVGPNLWDIVNRPIAIHEGFSYSAAMIAFSEDHNVHWDYEHLNEFIIAPKRHIPGTAMGFVGIKRDDERADLIAYMRTLSDNPAPLPVAAPEGAEATSADDGAAASGEAAPATAGEAAPAADDAATTTDGNTTEGAAPANADNATTTEDAAPAAEDPAPAAEDAAPAAEDGAAGEPTTEQPAQ